MSRGGARQGAGRPASRHRIGDLRRIDVRELARLGRLHAGDWICRWVGRDGGTIARLILKGGTANVDLIYLEAGSTAAAEVPLQRSACPLGGTRPWFQCPRCGCRVLFLYLQPSAIACGRCTGISHVTQRQNFCARSWRRQRRLEGRLGPELSKPPRMRAEHYQAIRAAILTCEVARARWLAGFLEGIQADLDAVRGWLVKR